MLLAKPRVAILFLVAFALCGTTLLRGGTREFPSKKISAFGAYNLGSTTSSDKPAIYYMAVSSGKIDVNDIVAKDASGHALTIGDKGVEKAMLKKFPWVKVCFTREQLEALAQTGTRITLTSGKKVVSIDVSAKQFSDLLVDADIYDDYRGKERETAARAEAKKISDELEAQRMAEENERQVAAKKKAKEREEEYTAWHANQNAEYQKRIDAIIKQAEEKKVAEKKKRQENAEKLAEENLKRRDTYLSKNPKLKGDIRFAISKGKLVVGMSKDDVEASMGWTSKRSRTTGATGTTEIWIYTIEEYNSEFDRTIALGTIHAYFADEILKSWSENS